MKAAAYILTFYLFLLSVIPCCTFDECPDDQPQTSQSKDHQPGDQDDCGSCSPFFNCERCIAVIIDVPASSITVAAPTSQRVYTEFVSQQIPDIHYDFWQPPRLEM
jgi:hypothetical protein